MFYIESFIDCCFAAVIDVCFVTTVEASCSVFEVIARALVSTACLTTAVSRCYSPFDSWRHSALRSLLSIGTVRFASVGQMNPNVS
jgi:hypothetical protein